MGKLIALTLLCVLSLSAQYVPPGGSGGGSTSPGSPDKSVQVACNGAFCGDQHLIWDSVSQLLTVGDESGLPGDIQGYVNYGRLYVPGLVGVAVHDNIGVYIATAATATVTEGVQVESTALADNVTLIDFTSLPAITAGHHAASAYSFSNYYGGTVQTGGVLDTYYFAYSKPLVGDGSIGNMVSYYAEDLAPGIGTTKYYNWFDSRGVRRIKEDATFDSVGQAIEALYNPLFAKYTPGAVNFERVILGQWNGNVAEIGNQAGGTGVLRPLKFIGASVTLPTTIIPALHSTTGTRFVCVDTAGNITSSATACSGT